MCDPLGNGPTNPNYNPFNPSDPLDLFRTLPCHLGELLDGIPPPPSLDGLFSVGDIGIYGSNAARLQDLDTVANMPGGLDSLVSDAQTEMTDEFTRVSSSEPSNTIDIWQLQMTNFRKLNLRTLLRLLWLLAPPPSLPQPPGFISVIPASPSQLAAGTGGRPIAVALFPNDSDPLPQNSASGQVNGPASADGDGLPDNFKNQLADAFTPLYHVSAGEQDQFGTYANNPLKETFDVPNGQNPLSYFRVKPLAITTDQNGVAQGFLRIDYLTLWNEDDGVVDTPACDVASAATGGYIGSNAKGLPPGSGRVGRGIAGLVGALFGYDIEHLILLIGHHMLDHEHSAVLVAAPAVNGSYNLDPALYSAVSYYTAAHEGLILFDHSMYLSPAQPVPAFNHISLSLSQSKHSTYAFNPDRYPLIWDPIIDAYFRVANSLYAVGLISSTAHNALLAIGDAFFITCEVENFTSGSGGVDGVGGAFASPRINVGEPVAGNVLNDAGFILASGGDGTTVPKAEGSIASVIVKACSQADRCGIAEVTLPTVPFGALTSVVNQVVLQ
jgi:hypothetical protein